MIKIINTIASNDNLTTLVCTLIGVISFFGAIFVIMFELHSKKNAIRYESRLNTRETKFESFISCLSEILGSPNIIFMSEYINRLTIEYYNLKIFTNSELDATLTKIVSECRSKYNSYQSDYITNLWDYYVRLKGYEDEELIEPGTNMIQFKYVLEEEIHNEIIAYKDKHAFSEDYIVSQLENISSKMKKLLNSLSR